MLSNLVRGFVRRFLRFSAEYAFLVFISGYAALHKTEHRTAVIDG